MYGQHSVVVIGGGRFGGGLHMMSQHGPLLPSEQA